MRLYKPRFFFHTDVGIFIKERKKNVMEFNTIQKEKYIPKAHGPPQSLFLSDEP